MVALGSGACSNPDAQLQQHREHLDSLRATATAIGQAWLAGYVSSTFSRTAFERTFELLARERQTMAASPDALLDPRAAQLSESADQLARLLSQMRHDVTTTDVASMQRHLSDVVAVLSGPR